MACGKLGQGSVVWACVHVLKDVSVITWPTAHKTEKQTGAVYTMGHSQGYTQRGYMFIHCESRGTWACVSVYWSSALKSWLCLWKIVSMKERSCTYQIPTEFKCSFMTWRKTYLFVCFIVEMEAAWYGFVQLCLQGGGFASYCALFDSCGLCEHNHTQEFHTDFK